MKRSFTLGFFFLTAWFLTMCDSQSCGCVQYDLGIEVGIEDAVGNDMLDPDADVHLEQQDITLYHEIKGKLEKYEWKNSGTGLAFQTRGDYNRVHIKSNRTPGNKVVTVLRIKDHPDIRIVTKVNGENGARVEKIWYKDELVWPIEGNDSFPRAITVTLD